MRTAFWGIALLTIPAAAEAAADMGEEIVITGTGIGATPGDAAYGTTTLDQSRLARDASGRLEDVLRDAAGFQMFRRTDSRAANPSSQGATLRALGGNAASRALMLLDGVPLADPFTGYIPYSAIDPARLGQVRVTRGGGAGPFGAGALTGTIEIDSAGPEQLPTLAASAAYGSRASSDLTGGVAARLNGAALTADAGWQHGDGYILIPKGQRGPVDLPAHYDSRHAAARAVVPLAPEVELQASGRTFDDHRLRGLAGTDSESRGTDFSLRLVGRGAWPFEALAYVQKRRFSSGFASASATRTSVSKTLDQYANPATGIGGKIELRPPVGTGQTLRIGADLRNARGTTHEAFSYTNGVATKDRAAGGHSRSFGAFIEDNLALGGLTLTGGARIDHWQIRGGHLDERLISSGAATQAISYPDRAGTEPTGRAGALLRLSNSFSVRTAAYIGWRLPTLNELYRPFRVGSDATAANPNLRIEKMKGVEGGAILTPVPGIRLDLTGFWNRLDNAVTNVTLGKGPGTFPQVGFVAAGGKFAQRLNVDAIRIRGIEATAAAALGDWHLSASYSFTDARVRASGVAAALNGLRPAESPRQQASATLAWAPEHGPFLSGTVRYVGRQYDDDLQTRVLPHATTVDARFELPVGHGVRLVARAENLFDARVVSGVSATGIQDIGTPRTLWIGVGIGL